MLLDIINFGFFVVFLNNFFLNICLNNTSNKMCRKPSCFVNAISKRLFSFYYEFCRFTNYKWLMHIIYIISSKKSYIC